MKRWIFIAGLGVALGAGWIMRSDPRGGHGPARGGVVIVPGRAPVEHQYLVAPAALSGPLGAGRGPLVGAPPEPDEDFGPGGIWDDRGAPGMWAPPEPPNTAD